MRLGGKLIARALLGAWLGLDVLGLGTASAQTLVNGAAPTAPGAFAQAGVGTAWTGSSAAGVEVSLLGPGAGSPSISCPYAGATWRIFGGGLFSTALTPGNITPKVVFGTGSVGRTITNILASASNAGWSGHVLITCVTVGSAGTMRATGGVTYATGEASTGTAWLNNDGVVITLDNRGVLPVDIRVTMATQSAANQFRLDVLAVERVY